MWAKPSRYKVWNGSNGCRPRQSTGRAAKAFRVNANSSLGWIFSLRVARREAPLVSQRWKPRTSSTSNPRQQPATPAQRPGQAPGAATEHLLQHLPTTGQLLIQIPDTLLTTRRQLFERLPLPFKPVQADPPDLLGRLNRAFQGRDPGHEFRLTVSEPCIEFL